tara:strand:- start:599 stop:1030 length:432 start_codon:yes stop_codon:yes gene_type:complete
MNFRNFLERSEEKMNVEKTLTNIPKAHRALVKDYKFKYTSNNTMKGDSEHIGEVDPDKKKITVAAPWNYGREFTTLHEIGHMVWATLPPAKQKSWNKICKGTKGKQDQNHEELFCMAYANTYAKHKIEIHNHPEWDKFIKSLS